jgi:diaminohydroxyphosphoribosylaminopyrimidine deaminase/5-amino-6-(5-phosphoribosylamino)uracil reductase
LIRPFIRAVTQGLPEVTLKLAATLDGRIADTSGEQRWVSGEEARLHGHGLRNASDSILVGVGTVLADNPRLTTRLPDGRKGRDPLRIVVDSRLRTPIDAHLVTAARETPTVLFTCTGNDPARMQALQDHGVELVEVAPNTAGRVDCESMLKELCVRGHHTLLCEGGSTLGAHLLRARLVQRVAWYVAPRILGPPHVLAIGEPVGVTGLDQPMSLTHVDVQRLGDDVVILGDVVYGDEEG